MAKIASAIFLSKRFRSEKGYVLYLAVVLLFVLSAYAGIVLTSQYLNVSAARHELNGLQAEVLAQSGLSLAQAYASGFENHGALWETQEIRREIPGKGTIILNAHHDAGWLQVISKGAYLRDTAIMQGTLGQAPPSFSANALSIGLSNNDIIVADRASLQGNVGTSGGKIITRSNGLFKGKAVPIKPAEYSDSASENEVASINRFFNDPKSRGTINTLSPAGLDSMTRFTGKIPETNVLVNGSESFKSMNVDFSGSRVFIQGNLIIEKTSFISNLKCYVKGTITIKDSSVTKGCTFISLENVKMQDNVIFTGNAVSAESLVVEGNSSVNYPSFLFLSAGGKPGNGNQVIIVRDNAIVKGAVATADFHDNATIPRIMVLGRAKVDGFVMCPGAITPYGAINASVYSGKIVYRQERNVYENWLREVSISFRDISRMTIPRLFPLDGQARYLNVSCIRGRQL
jgi:hypothetical protein